MAGCDITPGGDGIVCDVRDQASCVAAVETVVDRHGRLDILANVAGVGRLAADRRPLASTSGAR